MDKFHRKGTRQDCNRSLNRHLLQAEVFKSLILGESCDASDVEYLNVGTGVVIGFYVRVSSKKASMGAREPRGGAA